MWVKIIDADAVTYPTGRWVWTGVESTGGAEDAVLSNTGVSYLDGGPAASKPVTGVVGQFYQETDGGRRLWLWTDDWYQMGYVYSTSAPAALGTADAGSAIALARSDHVHPLPTAAAVGAAPTTHTHDVPTGAVGFVSHGADANVARPTTGFAVYIWRGTVQPANMGADDMFWDVS